MIADVRQWKECGEKIMESAHHHPLWEGSAYEKKKMGR